jgi:hypothetical protein
LLTCSLYEAHRARTLPPRSHSTPAGGRGRWGLAVVGPSSTGQGGEQAQEGEGMQRRGKEALIAAWP